MRLDISNFVRINESVVCYKLGICVSYCLLLILYTYILTHIIYNLLQYTHSNIYIYNNISIYNIINIDNEDAVQKRPQGAVQKVKPTFCRR